MSRGQGNSFFESGQRCALAASGRDLDWAWEQYKLEVRKRLVNRAESHLSAARLCWLTFCYYQLWRYIGMVDSFERFDYITFFFYVAMRQAE